MTVGTYTFTGAIVPVVVGSLNQIAAGTYDIAAYGAQGGGDQLSARPGGQGAMIAGRFTLTDGEHLRIVVGGVGETALNSGGGGGGSFVLADNGSGTYVPLVVAGGGGGGMFGYSYGGVIGSYGGDGGSPNRPGGTGGSGGSAEDESDGGGGGGSGLSGNGVSARNGGYGGTGFVGGLSLGGYRAGAGGFGGGGGAGFIPVSGGGGGGGGGYSGGGGGLGSGMVGRAGGGGSYDSGGYQARVPAQHAGSGLIVATFVPLGPTVTSVTTSGTGITSGAGVLAVGAAVSFTVNLSSVVTVLGTPTLTLNDGGTATFASGSNSSALIFSYSVLPGQNIADLAVTAVNLNAATIQDADENDADTSGAVTNPAGVLKIDTLAPTLAITSNVAQLKGGETATITFSFSEDPGATFTWNGTTGDVVVTGGTLGAISGTGLTRTATFTPAAGTEAGTASITVAAGVYTDPAGNTGGAGTTPAISIDTVAPTLAITSSVSQLKSGETATITFSFSEDPGATFTWNGTTGDVVVTGGTLGAISGTGLTRTATFTPSAGTGAGTASITVASGVYNDFAGNAGDAGTTPAISIDTLAPTLTITSSVSQLKSGEIATITFSFSEDPGPTFTWNGTTGDVVVTGGTLGAISGAGLTRTAIFTPAVGTGGGTASITVAPGVYTDFAGNTGGAGTTPAISIDTLAPTLTITSNVAQLTSGETATITFSFTEDPGPTFTWNGTTGDVVVTGGTLGAISGSGLTRTATFTPIAGTASGTASITVAAGVYTDSAGNTGGAGTTPAISIDTLAPSLISVIASGIGIDGSGNGNLGAGAVGVVVTLTLTLSDTVTVAGGVPTLTLNDGGTATFVSGSGSNALTFSYIVGSGQNTNDLAVTAVNLNSATIRDAAGNNADTTGALTSPPGTLRIDTAPPPVPFIISPALTDTAATVIAGTAEAGAIVTVSVPGATYSTIANGGSWSVDLATAVPASGAPALSTDSPNVVSVTATDPAGNVSESALQTLTVTLPTITGTIANQGVPDQTPNQPFATASIVDVLNQQIGLLSVPLGLRGPRVLLNASVGPNTLTVTLSAPGNGTLSGLSGGAYNASTGVYSVTGTPSVLTAALRALVFTPIAQPNVNVVTTGFTIALANAGRVDNVTSVTAVQQILGLAAVPTNQIVISVSPDGSAFAPVQPGMTNEAVITNPVAGQTYTVPAGYQALFLGGSTDATLSDAAVGNAYLVANSGSDILIANAPNDVLVAGSGNDSLFGGAFASTVAGGVGAATVFAGTGLMQVIQGAGTMVFGGNNNTGSSIFGGSGANGGSLSTNLTGQDQTVSVGSSAATITVSGSGGNVIGGTSSLDVTVSGTANTIQAGSGSNTVFFGGSGNRVVGSSVAGSGSSQIFETGSNNTIQGGVNPMAVTATGATQVSGGSGSLTFVGGTGVSSVFGGAGATTVSAGTGGVVLQLGSSVTASANSGTGAVTVFGSSGVTINLTGSSGKDFLVAGSGNETLNASASSSSNWLSVNTAAAASSAMLIGGSGSDTLIAGGAPGSTTMTGGSGSDAFVFFRQAVGGANDVIADFGAGDSIYIEGYAAGGSATALLAAASVGSSGLTLTLSDSTTISFSNLTNRTDLNGRIQYG